LQWGQVISILIGTDLWIPLFKEHSLLKL